MEQWSSRLGFVFAAIGAAVGLGNIWRFPAVVGQNGGGAYLVPYLIAAMAFAIPMMILEISVGRSLRADIVTACRTIRDEFEIVGWLIGGSVLAVLSYYLVITGWVLAFFIFTVFGIDTTFDQFTNSYQPIGFFILSTLLVGAIVSLGIQKGIERMAQVIIPFTFVVLIGLAVYATTLTGFSDGIRFFLTPDRAVLSDPSIWSAAFGQVFFSFSVGMGVLLTYGSYLGTDANVPKSSIVIAAADLTVALLAGLVIFAVVFSTDLVEPTSGSELAFVSLPTAFAEMPFGTGVAAAFFGLLFFAAVAPSVSMLEVGVAGTMRATEFSRQKASIVITGVILLAGLPSALSYSAVGVDVFDRPFLDLLDTTVGAFALPIGALAIVVIFVWLQDHDVVTNQIGTGLVYLLVKYVVPLVLFVVTSIRLLTDLDGFVGRRLPDIASIGGIGPFVVAVLLSLFVGLVGWRFSRSGRSH